MTTANRGKYAEGKVREHLKALEAAHANFTFERVYDAHAAGGRAQPQPGDFRAFYQPRNGWEAQGGEGQTPASRNWLIEVKEVKHDYRLPHANFSPDKVARMHKGALSGREPIVLVYHTEAKIWRNVPFAVFLKREGGSWDLRDSEPVDFKTSLNEAFGVTP